MGYDIKLTCASGEGEVKKCSLREINQLWSRVSLKPRSHTSETVSHFSTVLHGSKLLLTVLRAKARRKSFSFTRYGVLHKESDKRDASVIFLIL